MTLPTPQPAKACGGCPACKEAQRKEQLEAVKRAISTFGKPSHVR